MNVQTIFKSAMVFAALIAATITTNAEANDLTEASSKQLLELLNGDNVIVVMPSQDDTVRLVSASDVATTMEEVTQLSHVDNSENNSAYSSGIKLASGEMCASADCCTSTCCPTGCGTDSCCTQNCCEPETVFIGGVEAIFYWFDSNGNNGDIRTFDVDRNLVRRYTSSGFDDDGAITAPRIWLGVQRGNWGVVGRWWDLNVGDVGFDPVNGFLDFDGNSSSSEFRSYAFDLEVLRTFCFNSVYGNVSLGYRHGRLASGGGTSASSFIGPDFVTGSTYENSEFNGDGITFGLELHKCIGCGVNLFAKARGSVLWGDANATAAVTSSINTPFGSSAGAQYATAGSDEGTMSIAEIQAGVEWVHELKCAPAVAFLRCAFEWQTWQGDNDVEAFAISDSFAIPGAQIISRSSAQDQSVDLFGVAISMGFTY